MYNKSQNKLHNLGTKHYSAGLLNGPCHFNVPEVQIILVQTGQKLKHTFKRMARAENMNSYISIGP